MQSIRMRRQHKEPALETCYGLLCKHYTLVVRTSQVMRRYIGGIDRFKATYNVSHDEAIMAVRATSLEGLELVIKDLLLHGLEWGPDMIGLDASTEYELHKERVARGDKVGKELNLDCGWLYAFPLNGGVCIEYRPQGALGVEKSIPYWVRRRIILDSSLSPDIDDTDGPTERSATHMSPLWRPELEGAAQRAGKGQRKASTRVRGPDLRLRGGAGESVSTRNRPPRSGEPGSPEFEESQEKSVKALGEWVRGGTGKKK